MKISQADWESYWLCDNGIGVVDVHEDHALRVAEILSERHPGILFLWEAPTKSGQVTISAVKVNKRAFSGSAEEKIVAAGERIAENVANKYPARKRGLFARMFHKPLRPGWHFTEEK